MFVSRQSELETLNKLYNKDKFQMIVVYGRRRVGKTTLISEFVKNKPAVYFAAQEANEQLNLRLFSEKLYAFFGLPKETGALPSWYDAFMFVAKKAKESRFILAIDEFPYIAEPNKSIKSILQNIIDHELSNTGLYLILCGSQIGFMERETLGYKSPLFGRRTAQLKIEGFDYYDTAQMLSAVSDEDKMRYYACVGGTPYYLAQIDKNSCFEDNIKDLYFKPGGYLYNEPDMLLRTELREPAQYNSILAAIATGASKLNDISVKIGESTAKTIKYINTLTELNILRKEHPFGENPQRSRKGIYLILDNCFRFWYRYVFLNKQSIETGGGALLADTLVFPGLSGFIGKPAFEDACRAYLIRLNNSGKLPFIAASFGSWWGNDPQTRKNTDIDIILDNKAEKKIILCECKWRNDPVSAADVSQLLAKTHLLPGYDTYYFVYFTKSAYTQDARKITDTFPTLKLVTLDMLF